MSTKTNKKSFILHNDSLCIHEELSNEQLGKLFRAIILFQEGKEIELEPLLKIAFLPFKNQFFRDNEKYDDFIEKQSENGKKGGRPTKPKQTQKTQAFFEKPKKAYNKNVSDNDNVSDNIKYIVDYLNSKANTKYTYGGKITVQTITARLKDGFSVDDFKKVIDTRVDLWGKDLNMKQYLRPETLFGTKFESYLNGSPDENSVEYKRSYYKTNGMDAWWAKYGGQPAWDEFMQTNSDLIFPK